MVATMHPRLFKSIALVDEGAALLLKENWEDIEGFDPSALTLGAAFWWREDKILGYKFWADLADEVHRRGYAKRKITL